MGVGKLTTTTSGGSMRARCQIERQVGGVGGRGSSDDCAPTYSSSACFGAPVLRNVAVVAPRQSADDVDGSVGRKRFILLVLFAASRCPRPRSDRTSQVRPAPLCVCCRRRRLAGGGAPGLRREWPPLTCDATHSRG